MHAEESLKTPANKQNEKCKVLALNQNSSEVRCPSRTLTFYKESDIVCLCKNILHFLVAPLIHRISGILQLFAKFLMQKDSTGFGSYQAECDPTNNHMHHPKIASR